MKFSTLGNARVMTVGPQVGPSSYMVTAETDQGTTIIFRTGAPPAVGSAINFNFEWQA